MENNSKRWKFGIGIAIILSVAMWEAFSGFQQSKTYYVTVSELVGGNAARQHVRVGGTVEQGSITRRDAALWFRLAQNNKSIPVEYVGADTLPDTFKDGAKAVIEGSYTPDGAFKAARIQAKCASKYQAAPPGPKPKSMASATGWVEMGSPPSRNSK
ncbi:MAG: cytochrome c maturation protein CcmE [Terriglobia bacterium]